MMTQKIKQPCGQAVLYTMENGTRETFSAPLQQVLLVTSGECDVVFRGGRCRLNAGGWINIPSGETCCVHVFRSCGSCTLLRLCCEGQAQGIAFGNALELPMQDGTAYFALETGSVTGIVTRCAPEQPAASVRYDGEDRYFTFVPGADGAAYLRWLKDSFGILWENGVRAV